jgi:hypothetical protein
VISDTAPEPFLTSHSNHGPGVETHSTSASGDVRRNGLCQRPSLVRVSEAATLLRLLSVVLDLLL